MVDFPLLRLWLPNNQLFHGNAVASEDIPFQNNVGGSLFPVGKV